LPGVGKTTLVSLIARFFDPVAGRILVDGKDVRHVTLNSLRAASEWSCRRRIFLIRLFAKISAMLGRTRRFEEVQAAARRAHADAFIRELPHGYETIVGERGVKLSGG
jgi:ABC-type multidrug transport system fused ATPase/permease subunit